MAYNFPQNYGIIGFDRLRRRGYGAAPWNLDVNSMADNKPVRVNSRDYVQTSGSSIGMQCKPNQTATTTGDVIGAEFSPRVTDAGSGALIALKGDAVIKAATSARTLSAVRGIELNTPSFPTSGSAYTVTNDVSAIRIFPDFGSGHTFTGKKSVIKLATPNNGAWDYLLDVDTNGIALGSAGTYSTADGYFVIRAGGSDRRIPFFDAAD